MSFENNYLTELPNELQDIIYKKIFDNVVREIPLKFFVKKRIDDDDKAPRFADDYDRGCMFGGYCNTYKHKLMNKKCGIENLYGYIRTDAGFDPNSTNMFVRDIIKHNDARRKYNRLTNWDYRMMCKENNIKGYSKMDKLEMIKALIAV
jgi:hypothetical protein